VRASAIARCIDTAERPQPKQTNNNPINRREKKE
jgi:hypothetical protein